MINIDEKIEKYLNEGNKIVTIVKDDSFISKNITGGGDWDFSKGDMFEITGKDGNTNIVSLIKHKNKYNELKKQEKEDGLGISDTFLKELIKRGVAVIK